jgi:hypothetical protein
MSATSRDGWHGFRASPHFDRLILTHGAPSFQLVDMVEYCHVIDASEPCAAG